MQIDEMRSPYVYSLEKGTMAELQATQSQTPEVVVDSNSSPEGSAPQTPQDPWARQKCLLMRNSYATPMKFYENWIKFNNIS